MPLRTPFIIDLSEQTFQEPVFGCLVYCRRLLLTSKFWGLNSRIPPKRQDSYLQLDFRRLVLRCKIEYINFPHIDCTIWFHIGKKKGKWVYGNGKVDF